MKKDNTGKKSARNRKGGNRKPTVGIDLGDRSSRYCILDEQGEVLAEGSVATGLDRVVALPIVPLGRGDLQAHLFPDGPRKETANGMRLPPGSFHQFFESGTFRPFQQVNDLGRLAAFAGATRFLYPFGRFLRPAALLGPFGLLGRDVRALCRNRGGRAFCGGHVCVRTLSALSLRMTIHHSVPATKQVESNTQVVASAPMQEMRERGVGAVKISGALQSRTAGPENLRGREIGLGGGIPTLFESGSTVIAARANRRGGQ